MVAWWTSRSMSAAASMALPRISPPLLEADEVGYLPLERSAADLLFTLVSRR